MPPLPLWIRTDLYLNRTLAVVALLLALGQGLSFAIPPGQGPLLLVWFVAVGMLCAAESWHIRRHAARWMPAMVLPMALAGTTLLTAWKGHYSANTWLLTTFFLLFLRLPVQRATRWSIALMGLVALITQLLWDVPATGMARSMLAGVLVLALLAASSLAIQTMNAKLARSNGMLRSTLDTMAQGLILLDASGHVILHNQRAHELLNLPKSIFDKSPTLSEIVAFQQARGDFGPQFDRVDPNGRDYVATLGTRDPAHKIPARYTRRTDDGRHIEVVSRPQPNGMVVRTYTDVTPYMDALRAAEVAARAKTQFLANMNHELRTPLNAVIGFSGLLLTSPLTTQQHEQAHQIQLSGESLLHMLNGVLEYAQMDTSGADPGQRLQPLHVQALLDAVTAEHLREAQAKGLRLRQQVMPATPPHIEGHARHLAQVLDHLVGNAIKFTQVGEVRVLARAHEGGTVFEVQDTGIGIPAHFLPHVFDPFSQAHASNTRLYGGAGLGTALCRRRVEQMRGRISVQSQEGVGTRFEVWLPWQAPRCN